MRTFISITCMRSTSSIPLYHTIQLLRPRIPLLVLRAMPKTSKSNKTGARNHDNPPKQDKTTSQCVWAKDGDIFITVHAKPGARQSCVTDISDSQVSIQIAAPAQEGEANDELVRALASIVSVQSVLIMDTDLGRRELG